MKTRFRFLFFIIPLAFILLGSLAFMALWNWLMPSLFAFGTITYPQALGILVLIRILTWGGGWFRWRRYSYAYAGCYPHYHPFHHGMEHWRTRLREKWESMSPEEKEKWKSRCGGWFPDENPGEEKATQA
jgi:Ca2+/H+ antiporter, TMEM165/GDT1 family